MLSPLMLSSVVHLTKEDHFAFFAFDQAASWCKLNRSRNRLALYFVSRRLLSCWDKVACSNLYDSRDV